jgi:membrane-associated protease RseP (regulator of RpoE activity)
MKSFLYLFAPLSLAFVQPALGDDSKQAKDKVFQIPYRLTATEHVLVRAKINGKGPFNFILDTGAPALFVSTAIGKKLDLTADKSGWATLNRFAFEGGAVVTKAKARIEDPFQLEGMNGLGLAGAHLDGIIGYNILARFRIEFDFTKDRLAFTSLDYDPPPPQGLEGGAAAAGGLDAMAAIMKFLGGMLGQKAEPEIILSGFFGLQLSEEKEGLTVKGVLAQSPADLAGLQAGDRISQFQGKSVTSAKDFRRQVSKLPAGTAVQLTAMRQEKTREVTVQLGRGF